MPDTTFEEACRCPQCGTPGEDRSQQTIPGGDKVHMLYCVNSRCKWSAEAPWLVQVRPDGTIPTRKPGPQQFQPRSEDYYAAGRRYLEDAIGKDLRDES